LMWTSFVMLADPSHPWIHSLKAEYPLRHLYIFYGNQLIIKSSASKCLSMNMMKLLSSCLVIRQTGKFVEFCFNDHCCFNNAVTSTVRNLI
jgi:hypothetical protein